MATILLVENEPILSMCIKHDLLIVGFDVTTAPNGRRALETIADAKQSLSGVITDIRLGDDVSGWEVGRAARALNSDVPVVYMSGIEGPNWSSEKVSHSFFVQKPFQNNAVVLAISRLTRDLGNRPCPVEQTTVSAGTQK